MSEKSCICATHGLRYSASIKHMKKLLAVCFPAMLALALSRPVQATPAQVERIHRFDDQLTVNPDGSLLVNETIDVEAAGINIQHGIYRDIPLIYQDRMGNRYAVRFDIVSLVRDGNVEPYHTADQSNGIRIYFGSSTYELPPGPHTYQFRYRVERVLGYFPDYDQLYWNVTGTGWRFPIDVTTATVLLPAHARDGITDLRAFTGRQGEQGHAYSVTRDEAGNPVFQAEPLAPGEGLTLVVNWPKGLVAEPTAAQKRAWFVADNKATIAGVAGLVIALLYYLLAWSMVGRDPASGTIVPLYAPPDNMSPAAVRFLERMGFDEKTFTAGIMGLAAKGYLAIELDDSKTYKLIRKNTLADSKLFNDESGLARTLFEDGSPLVLTNEKHTLLTRARKGLENNLHAAIETNCFVTNSRYLWPGIILSVLSIAAMAVLGGGPRIAITLFMAVWLTGWSFGVYMLVSSAVRAWKSVKSQGVLAAGQAGFLTLFSLPFVAGECFGLGLLYWANGLAGCCIIASALIINVLFHHLMKAPTRAGRALMDRIDGFKMFLAAVDANRLQTMVPPDKTPQLFEKFLPYAVALDVEHAWSSQFSQVLARAATGGGGAGYSPSWYTGSGFSSSSPAQFTSSFSSSFSSAISSSSSAPGSSSGSSGGGSSGGGGGGGGGGGW